MLSAMKEKMDDWKTKALAKQVNQLRTNNAKLEQQLAALQEGRITETMETTRKNPATNNGDENIEKRFCEKTPVELQEILVTIRQGGTTLLKQ